MKEIFLAVTAQLKTITSLVWIDDDWGQADNYELRPEVDFPAALVSISYPNTDDLHEEGGGTQLVKAQVTIRLVFDGLMGETSVAAPDEVRAAALARYDVAEAVHAAMQGFDNAGSMNAMSRASQISESRRDTYKVIRMVYKCEFMESV
jgi:hypothetical protein